MFFAMLFVVLNKRKHDKILGIGYIKALCKYKHELTYKEHTYTHTHTHTHRQKYGRQCRIMVY